MKKRIPTLLATMIASALYSHQGLAADLASQCMLGVPSYDRPLVQGETNELPVTINADNAKGNYPDDAVFTGNVDIAQGNSRLQADEVQLHQKQAEGQPEPIRTVDALGNVHYDDNQVILKGPKGWSNLNTKDTNIWEGDYQMVGRQGRGKADLMKQRGENRYTILENGSFTSCLPGSDTWSVVGSEVIHDREEQVAEIWNARFKLGPVPVFYSPYLQLPVGDKRRSGFLIPNAKYSTNNYFEFYLPYYWNIAPNMDATITPHYMHRRGGIMWENEFRYLTQAGAGLMEFDYLNSDKVYEDEHPKDDNSRRWLFYWQHSGVMDQVWRFNVDYTKVSDTSYFNDFDNKYGSSTDGYATQKFSVGYAVQNFDATVSTKQFQVFDAQNSNSYSAQPQLDVNYYQNDVGPFDTRIYGQAVHFVNTNDNMPEATRVHLEPTINLPLSNNWGSINTEAKLLATHYQQTNLDWYNSNPQNTKLDDSANRVMPQFKVDGKMVFERDMQMLAPGYTQTLEPRAQYLYVPYRDQSHIYNYDSSLLQSDYSGLFRDRTYGGLDRIASANQVTTGVTSRVYDDAAVERFNISVGQIYYFTESRTGDDNIKWENDDKTGSLVWAGDTYWRISDRWGLRSGIQYDTRLDSVATSSSSIEYRRDENRMLQLNYRYASSEYIQATLPSYYSTAEQYKNGISQVGAVASFPIADRWSIVGAYYFDTNVNKEADSMLGLQYNSCCYAIRFGYERKLNGWDNTQKHAIYDNTIGFNIELRGLSSNYGLGTNQMLRSNILPYQSAL
ncbi:LPS assembly protein LptD [Citrobacter freundii]|uniref:LPS assembly protein LptD n=1 Tax=Citrobacter freundii TaxID=546 RepID=UPI000299C293|nr:LPS assembly protein LptD [Citrobacter freundii]EKS57672.1 LPS assembly outer membrane complex protein LptD [Citrobacter freundii ATCC 8090 = MTCC 1658 = NBRC 12681]ELK6450254.1 LPS assembly protein LptD [Citrobacter freundii]EXF30862.1 LPS assembly outer membrane complex protein LptD [Citrobacter freundii RLS1]KFB94281.1 organic solvent tolerance protein [Citrobacter freundii ATCC 8090 = MTCC 1658 = NBRC 12681]MDE5191852.1 LPS assembly protein LptD [Citrobacter freundii]